MNVCNSIILLWILQVCVKFGYSFENLPCPKNYSCKAISECKPSCAKKQLADCSVSTYETGECCPDPRHMRTSASSNYFLLVKYGCNKAEIPTFYCFSTMRKSNFQSHRHSAEMPLISVECSDECAEYKEHACEESSATGQLKKHPIPCPSEQGNLIVGGQEPAINEFPHMALIGYGDSSNIIWKCGGSLISERFVLTAAHCIENESGPPKYVRLGEHNLNRTDEANHTDYGVIKSYKHENHSNPKSYNDIGLLKLDRNVTFSSTIRPACLPEQAITPEKAIVSGWGFSGKIDISEKFLLKTTVEYILPDNCTVDNDLGNSKGDATLPLGIDSQTQLCYGSTRHINNTCEGDSGGPIQIYHQLHYCSYTVFGVTSFGTKCESGFTPGSSATYTQVYGFLNWIEEKVWPNYENN